MSLFLLTGIGLNDTSMSCAFAGDHVTLTITGMDMTNIYLG